MVYIIVCWPEQVAADEMDFAYADEFVRALDSATTAGAGAASHRKHQHPCRGEVLTLTPAFSPFLAPLLSQYWSRFAVCTESNRAPDVRVSAVIYRRVGT